MKKVATLTILSVVLVFIAISAFYFFTSKTIPEVQTGSEYFGNEARGDINGDGVEDIVFIVTKQPGGSGTFFYVTAGIGGKGYKGTNELLLGDRIAPQSTEIKNGEIIVNYADRAFDAPMSTPPNIGVSKHFKFENGTLLEIKYL